MPRPRRPIPTYTEDELLLLSETYAGNVVYLIHFDVPLPAFTVKKVNYRTKVIHRTVSHYIGTTKNLRQRIEQHKTTTWEAYADGEREQRPHAIVKGNKHNPKRGGNGTARGRTIGDGATLLGYANSLGIPWHLVRVWDASGVEVERRLKKYRNSRLLCPECHNL